MTRAVHVKHARKDYPEAGIKRGEPYYWWKFRMGPKHLSKTPPRPSQLTGSEFLSMMYGLQERLEDLAGDDLEALKSERDDLVSELRQLAEEQQEKHDNMPEGLQQGDTGQLLEERQQETEAMADELENVDLNLEREDGETDADFAKRVEDALGELQGVSYGGS